MTEIYRIYFFHFLSSSFLDDAFRKNHKSALRFGKPLPVQVRPVRNIYLSTYCLYQGFNIMLCISNNIKDVARHEPILNPVLNREVGHTGGDMSSSLLLTMT